MMRRGEARILGNILVQLMIVGAIVFLIWFPFADKALDGELFVETVYATDNALLAESLLGVPSGEMTVAYLLADEAYTISLDEGLFGITNARRKGLSVRRDFAIMHDSLLEVFPSVFTPTMYTWQRTPTTLGINVVSTNPLCPRVPEDIDWDDGVVYFSGPQYAARVLNDGLSLSSFARERRGGEQGLTALTIKESASDTIIIEHGKHQISQRFACLSMQELFVAEVAPVVVEERYGMSVGDGIVISVPESIDSKIIERALTNAYKKFSDTDGDH